MNIGFVVLALLTIGGIAIVIGMIWSVVHMLGSSGGEPSGKEEPLPPRELAERWATVVEMRPVIEHTGSVKRPSHRNLFLVTFRLDDGGELSLDVGAACFERIHVGERELLLTEDGCFLDFGGRFGEDLPEDGETSSP